MERPVGSQCPIFQQCRALPSTAVGKMWQKSRITYAWLAASFSMRC
jgi:hypothetical protein